MCALWEFLEFDMIFLGLFCSRFSSFSGLIVLIHQSHSVIRHRARAMTIAREPHYAGQHVFQYEYKCLLMDISDLSENSFTMFFDPQNIGLETCYTQ